MNPIRLGHHEAHEKLTAKLFWKPAGSSGGYDSAGNVRDYVDASTRSLVTRPRAEDGARQVNAEQADVNHECYTFLLDERVPEQDRLLKLARRLEDQHQAGGEGSSATLEAVEPGKWFDLGAYNIANVRVTSAFGGSQDEGDDYQVDSPNGRLYVVPGGGIGSGDTLSVTFDQPGVGFQKQDQPGSALNYVDVIFEEHSQFSKTWLRRLAFRGYLNAVEFPAQTGEFGTYRVKATASGPVTVHKRPEAPLAAAPQGGDAAQSSSSSSSSPTSASSYSSGSSQSSQSSSGSSKSSSSTAVSVTSSSSSYSSNVSSSSSSSREFASFSSSSSSSTNASQTSSYSSQSSSSSSEVIWKVSSFSGINVGAGYTVGDILTFPYGTYVDVAAVRVEAVDQDGSISSHSSYPGAFPGSYSVIPSNPLVAVGGSGSGAVFELTWQAF